MDVNREKKHIKIRCSDMARICICQRRLAYMADRTYEDGPSSVLANVGTIVHSFIEKVMDPEKENPTPEEVQAADIKPTEMATVKQTDQPSNILANYNTTYTEGVELRRASYVVSYKEIIEKDRFSIRTDQMPEYRDVVGFTGAITREDVIKELSIYLNGLVDLRAEEGDNILFMSPTRGPGSTLDIPTPFVSKRPIKGTMLIDALYPEVFGKPLRILEKRLEYDIIHRGWRITVGGTADALTEDGSLIVDWKTAGRSPNKNDDKDYDNVSYQIQASIYRMLWCIQNKLPITPGNAILAYLIKNKSPVFLCKGYTIDKATLETAKNVIMKSIDIIIDRIEHGILPFPGVSWLCRYCTSQVECQSEWHFFPRSAYLPAIMEFE